MHLFLHFLFCITSHIDHFSIFVFDLQVFFFWKKRHITKDLYGFCRTWYTYLLEISNNSVILPFILLEIFSPNNFVIQLTLISLNICNIHLAGMCHNALFYSSLTVFKLHLLLICLFFNERHLLRDSLPLITEGKANTRVLRSLKWIIDRKFFHFLPSFMQNLYLFRSALKLCHMIWGFIRYDVDMGQ